MTKEIWRNVQSLKCPWFLVSNLGRCKTIDHIEGCYIKGKYVERVRPGIVKSPTLCERGRQQVGIGNKRLAMVHRLVAEAFVPKKKGMNFVIWKDGNKLNNCSSNLEWVDQSRVSKNRNKTFFNNHGRAIGAYKEPYDTKPFKVFESLVEAAKFCKVTKQAMHFWMKEGHEMKRHNGLYFIRYLDFIPPKDNITYG